MVLKCRLGSCRSGFCISNQLPGHADAAGPRGLSWAVEGQATVRKSDKCTSRVSALPPEEGPGDCEGSRPKGDSGNGNLGME